MADADLLKSLFLLITILFLTTIFANVLQEEQADVSSSQINNLTVTCSFGVSEFLKDDLKETIMKRADDALYLSKGNGRNQVTSK